MQMQYSLVSKKRTKKYLFALLFFLSSLVSLLLSLFLLEGNNVINVSLAVCLLLGAIFLSYVKQHVEIGEIIFSKSGSFSIKSQDIGNHEFHFDTLEEPKLVLSSFERKIITGVAFTNEGTSGLGNILRFSFKNGNDYRLEIFIKTKSQFDFLKNLKDEFSLPPSIPKLF